MADTKIALFRKFMWINNASRFDYVCLPIVNPRYKREKIQGPAKNRPGALTRSDLCMTSSGMSIQCRDEKLPEKTKKQHCNYISHGSQTENGIVK